MTMSKKPGKAAKQAAKKRNLKALQSEKRITGRRVKSDERLKQDAKAA